jgi:hypothetical protein
VQRALPFSGRDGLPWTAACSQPLMTLCSAVAETITCLGSAGATGARTQEHLHAPTLPMFFRVIADFGVPAVDLSPVLGSERRLRDALREAGFSEVEVRCSSLLVSSVRTGSMRTVLLWLGVLHTAPACACEAAARCWRLQICRVHQCRAVWSR